MHIFCARLVSQGAEIQNCHYCRVAGQKFDLHNTVKPICLQFSYMFIIQVLN